MSRWMMNLILHEEPVCPVCGNDLLPDVAIFRCGVAVCVICSERITAQELHMLIAAIDADPQRQNYTSANGLLFHTPRSVQHPRRPLFHALTGHFLGDVPSYADGRYTDERLASLAARTRRRGPQREPDPPYPSA